VTLVLKKVMLRVKKTLPHRRNDAHERLRIAPLFLAPAGRFEGDMLKHIWTNDGIVRIALRERNQHAGAANNAPAWHDITDGESQLAQRLQGFGIRRNALDHAMFGRDGGQLRAWPWSARV